MNKIVDYKKDKKRAMTGIVVSALLLMVGLIAGLTGLFFYLDSVAVAAEARGRETAFDPWEDSSSGIQDSWKTWEIVGLTDEFAADFKETYHYYFAFDPDWYLTIVKMKGELGEEFQPCLDFVYEDEAEEPEPVRVRGVAVPIEDDIREYAIECLNILYDDENFMTEEYFEDYMGISLLDMTRKPTGRAIFRGTSLFVIFGVFGSVGFVLLIANIMSRNQACLEEERAKETMRRMAAWQSSPGEDSAGYRWSDGGTQRAGEWPGGGGSAQGTGGWQGSGGGRGGGWPDAGGNQNSGWPNSGGSQGGAGFGTGGEVYNADGGRLTPVKKSNVFLGIIGAIGGSLIGVILWVGISLIGFIAGVAGFAMLKFALKGYEKLSGKLDKKGAVISLLIAAFMVFFANVADYVVTLCQAFFEWDASLDTVRYVIMNFGTLMTDADCWGGFILNLMIGYALSIWASFSLIRAILKYKEN